jgi:Phytanoyl-CoA dioxygenase (PhyH)
VEVGALEGVDRLEAVNLVTAPLHDASSSLGQPERLREIAERDGFVYFRELVPADLVLSLRQTVLEFAAGIGWLEPGTSPAEARAMPGKRVGYYEDPDWVNLQVHVQMRSEMWNLGDCSHIHRALRALDGRSTYLYLSTANTCRIFSPHADMATQPHQDAHYFRVIGHFWTAWIPLGDCPRELGPLALLPASHVDGLRSHTGLGIVDGGVAVSEQAVWLTTDFRCGDVVLFRSHTLHRSLPNQSGSLLRLSADFRYGFWDETATVDWRASSLSQ